MEVGTNNPNLNQNQIAEELGLFDSLKKRFGIDIFLSAFITEKKLFKKDELPGASWKPIQSTNRNPNQNLKVMRILTKTTQMKLWKKL